MKEPKWEIIIIILSLLIIWCSFSNPQIPATDIHTQTYAIGYIFSVPFWYNNYKQVEIMVSFMLQILFGSSILKEEKKNIMLKFKKSPCCIEKKMKNFKSRHFIHEYIQKSCTKSLQMIS